MLLCELFKDTASPMNEGGQKSTIVSIRWHFNRLSEESQEIVRAHGHRRSYLQTSA